MISRLAPVALAVLVLLPSLSAQSSKVERDVSFVRALAEKLRFISLAQSEADRLKKEYQDSNDFKSVAQLGIDISVIGAKLHPNRETRRTLFKDALKRMEDLISRYPNDPVAMQSRITMSDASIEYGRNLVEEISIARSEEPDKVQTLEEEAASVFRGGVTAANKAMSGLERLKDANATDSLRYHLSWLRKGILLREHGRAVRKDRDHLVDRAREELEELIFDVGEETALGLKGLLEMATCDEVMGDLDAAETAFQDVIDAADMALKDERLDLSGDIRELMVILMEEAYNRRGQALFQLGKSDDVLTLVADYRKHLESLNVPVTKYESGKFIDGKEDFRFGHALYIIEARAMAESGKPELVARSLEQAKYYNQKHPNDAIGLQAKTVIKDILAAQSMLVSAQLLLEVAKGDYQAKNYEIAIHGFKRALAAMSNEEKATSAVEAYYSLAQCFILQNRAVEATLALKSGLDKYGSSCPDKATVEKASDLIERTMRQVRALSKSDSYFDQLNDEITALTARFGSTASASKQYWNKGIGAIREGKYADAIGHYTKITPDSIYYEWAQARIVSANQRLGDHAAARKTVAAYRQWLESKEAILADDRSDLRQTRALAQSEIDFYDGYMLFVEAEGRGGKKNLTLYPKAIAALSDWEGRHSQISPSLLPRVLYVIGKSHVVTGALNKAEEQYRKLQKVAPRDVIVANLAAAVFTAFNDQVKAMELTVSSDEVRTNKSQLLAETQKLESLRRQLLALGRDYLKGSDKPQYGIAYITLLQAEALKDWQLVESLGANIIELFGEDSKSKDRVQRFVKLIVGQAVLKQHKYRQAHDLLSATEKASPKNYPLKRLIAMSLGGWKEIDDRGTIKTYQGLGDPKKAYDKMWREYKSYALNSLRGVTDYSTPWYLFHWECYYYAVQAGKDDTNYRRYANTLYSKARATDEFAKLSEMGSTDSQAYELYQLFQANPPPR